MRTLALLILVVASCSKQRPHPSITITLEAGGCEMIAIDSTEVK